MKFTKGIFASFLVFAFVFAAAQTASAYTHMGMLKMGSTGSQVMELQKALNGNGFLISTTGAGSPGMESSYFGAKTKSAVMAFQSAKGLTPVDGIVGINTGAALGALTTTTPTGPLCPNGNTVASSCMTAPAGTPTGPTCPNGNLISNNCAPSGTTTPTGPLAGTDGSINDVNELSQYSSEEVGEGQSDVKVVGFEVEATNDGDIAIKSAKLSFTITNASGSDNLDDYIDGASIWMGSTKVGSADAGDFSEGSSGVWTKTVTLSNPVVKSDETEKFYVSVDAANSFDSGDIDSEVFTADVDNLRFADGSGVITTEDGYDLGSMDVNVSFVTFSTAADTELKITAASDSPDAGIAMVDDTSDTDNVSLLKGKFKLEGTSDVLIDELPITITTSGDSLSAVASSLTLKIGGKTYTESVGANCSTDCATVQTATVTFDDLDFTIDSEDTVEFEILADINDIENTGVTATDFDEGDTLLASLTSTNRAFMDAENEEGDQLTSSEKTGTSTGEAQELRSNGIMLTLVSTNATSSNSTTNDQDTATFTIKFKVTAIGDSVYVSTVASTAGSANNVYAVDYSGTSTLTDVSGIITNNTDTDLSGGLWYIEEGSPETLTLQVLRAPSATDDLFRAALSSLKWNTTGSTTTFNSYTSNLDDFKTDYVSLD